MYEGQSPLTLTCLRYVVLMLALTIFCVMNENIKHCFVNKFQLAENLSSKKPKTANLLFLTMACSGVYLS